MSDSEGEEISIADFHDSEESDFAPATKKGKGSVTKQPPKASKKAPTSKASKPAKAPAKASKKKPLASIDENVQDPASDFMDVDDSDSDASEAGPSKKAPTKAKKTASEMYQQLTPIEHILKRPDSYIGSVETHTDKLWVYDSKSGRMVLRDVKYVPGFFKIVDEILVNAADNKINDPNMDTLKINIDVENNTISVWNNGRGIPIEIHSKTKIYIPEMIFGHLLTSSNYDDDEKKLTGGRNGYGAKLTNIYSTEFIVETADKNTSQKYKQVFTNNMGTKGAPKITKNSKNEEFTHITFKPDLARFGMETIDKDTEALLKKRVYDMAGTVRDIKVVLNGERLKIKNFKSYCEMYLSSASAEAVEKGSGASLNKPTLVYEEINDRWAVGYALSDSGTFQHISFANSISTIKGGTHVGLVADQIVKGLQAHIEKKNKGAKVGPAQIKNHMWIFVRALIENPTFDSQTKETLTLLSSKFGGKKPALSEDFMKRVLKSGIVDNVLSWAKFKSEQLIRNTDGKKHTRLTGLTKLSDANNAGSKLAHKCTLILTEGDSAKALAEAGLSVVGRDNFGVFPLRGKLLNVREASHDQIMKNQEIQNIKKIMGLVHGKAYEDLKGLRYGSIMIMADQDHDGSHIKGLLINLLDHFFPSLLRMSGFLVEFVTPIVRAMKGKQKIDFFTMEEFKQWNEENNRDGKWSTKYYKGLGTSNDNDAMEYFSHTEKHVIPFSAVKQEERDLIDMAFSKKRADDRKEWLRNFKPGTFIEHDVDEIEIKDFINRELICYSIADNMRSIPCVVDGLKPGQRKVIFGCFKRKLKSEIKVAQLIGYISEKTAYHHGEQSLATTIIALAQTFVGSNNINLLSPNDGDSIEPEWYVPVIPLVLVNGAQGIGTGYSTTIPNFNPVDIVANIRRLMNNEPMGTVEKGEDGKFTVHGIVNKIDRETIEITELPVYVWTQDYKERLEKWVTGSDNTPPYVKDYKEYHTNTTVHFVITMTSEGMKKAEAEGLYKFFKCTAPIATSNMMAFDANNKLRKYATPEEIIEDFFPLRMRFYQKRKDYLCNELRNQWEKLSNQARFVQMIIDRKLVVSRRKKADIVAELRKLEFRPFLKGSKAKTTEEGEPAEDNADEEEEDTGSSSDYDYLLGMAIWSLTDEKVAKLLRERDAKQQELEVLLAVKPSEMWDNDLEKLLDDFEKLLEHDAEISRKAAKGKKASATLKTRKSLTGGKTKGKKFDSDEDDDFKPSKATAKKATTKVATDKPKATARAKAAFDEDSAPSKSTSKNESDFEAPVVKKKAAAKKPALPTSDSDVDMRPTTKKPAAKRK
ncbi:DNA topoisomerase 2, partial [Tulasnella sp. 403]